MNDKCCTPTTTTETAKPETAFRPDADMRETADGWVFEIDLPGVRREHLRIEVNDGVLELSAEAQAGGSTPSSIRWSTSGASGSATRSTWNGSAPTSSAACSPCGSLGPRPRSRARSK